MTLAAMIGLYLIEPKPPDSDIPPLCDRVPLVVYVEPVRKFEAIRCRGTRKR